MNDTKIIVIGTSAGGVETLLSLVSEIDPAINAALAIVMHIPAEPASQLPMVLSRKCALPIEHAKDGGTLERGHIYVAPADYHLTFEGERTQLMRGPRVNQHRPSIDVTFRSASANFGRNVIGVILTGTLSDGALGLAAITKAGGIGIVQDPEEAMFSAMPEHAIAAAHPRYIIPLSEIADVLFNLSNNTIPSSTHVEKGGTMDLTEKIEGDLTNEESVPADEKKSVFSCPDCGGALWEVSQNGTLHFACHQGHELSAEALEEGQSDKLEEALWTAARIMKEKALLFRKIAENFLQSGNVRSNERFTKKAEELEQHLVVFRDSLIHDKSLEAILEE